MSVAPSPPGVCCRISRAASAYSGAMTKHELAFVRDMKRIETEQLACAAHRIANRYAFFKQQHAQFAIARQLIQRCGNSAARGIAHPANAGACFFRKSFDEAGAQSACRRRSRLPDRVRRERAE